jgi:ferredoxin
MKIKIIHYREKCIGCFACAEFASMRWRMSKKDGKSVLLGGTNNNGVFNTEIEEDEYYENKLVAKMCPAKVIKVIKIQTK